jgi:signal transduction histidine kinase
MLGIQTKPSLYRDFALLSAMIIFVLLLVSLWIVYKTYQSHSKDILQQLENEAIRIDRALIIEIEEASYLLESIGRQIDTKRTDLEPQIQRLFGSFASNQPLRGSEFYWIDANQRITISGHAGALAEPIEIADRDYMKRALTTPWKIHIGQPVEGRVSGAWVIPIAMGIASADNEFIGAVSISLNIKQLSDVISNVIKEPEIDYAITNTSFTLLTQISEDTDFFARYFSMARLSEIDFSQTPSGVFSAASWWASDQIYAYYEQSSQYPYIIFVGYDPVYSRSAIDDILLPRLLQIVIMTLFLLLTLWTVRKRIIQPVMRLTEHTQRILRGEKFSHSTANDPIEIEQLAQEIERLSAYIDERRRIEHELARKNSALMQIKESAEVTNHLKATFFEQVGEALMQPARAISEYIDSMRDELFGPIENEKYQEMAESMHLESLGIMETLADIRAISQAESGLLALNERPVDLDFVIKKCIRLLKECQPFAQVDVILDLDDEMPKISADELRLKQLILNLLMGAASEISNSDAIRLNTLHLNGEVRIEITYKPSTDSLSKSEQPSQLLRGIAPYSAGFLKLGHALSDLIVAMHGGTLSTKPLPDQMVKKIITLPESRLINAAK